MSRPRSKKTCVVSVPDPTFAKARLGPLKLASGGELALVMTGALANSQQFINATVDCPLPELGLQERNSA